MRILLPTGSATKKMVDSAAKTVDADVVVTGEVASFLTPGMLSDLLKKGEYDMVIVSGMCTASFVDVERKSGVPVYRGPRHAADLGFILGNLNTISLSKTEPADLYLENKRRNEAIQKITKHEEKAGFAFRIRDLKIGGMSRIKVLAEIMDAHREEALRARAEDYLSRGADIVDLGFGFDATPEDVKRCINTLSGLGGVIAADTQDPELIGEACRSGADMILSLHDRNLPEVGELVAETGVAAVIVPHEKTLITNIRSAEGYGIEKIIADPLLQPVGSGLVDSLSGFGEGHDYPSFFGAGNVVELLDGDSVGANLLLCGMAYEAGASIIFTSEHSDKTSGSVSEMRRASKMMALMENRPYPKDLGLDLFRIKEKRRRREPPLSYGSINDSKPAPGKLTYDPLGCIRIGIEDGKIVAVHNGDAVRGDRWEEVFSGLLTGGRVSLMDHAAYLGKELYKAELAIRFGRSFEQDGEF